MTQGVFFHVAPAADPFADWVYRPDYRGRMGWEAPNLPAWLCWWRFCEFEELPERLTPIGAARPPGVIDGP
jgi:hypothetical protein